MATQLKSKKDGDIYVASPTLFYPVHNSDKEKLRVLVKSVFENDYLPNQFKFHSVEDKDLTPFYCDVFQDRSTAISDTVTVILVLDTVKLKQAYLVRESKKLPTKKGQQRAIRIYSHGPFLSDIHKYILAIDVLMQADVSTINAVKDYAEKFNLPIRYYESRFDMILGTDFIYQTQPEKKPTEKINPLEDYYKQLKQLNAFLRALKDYRTNIKIEDTVPSYIMRQTKIPEHSIKTWLLGDTLVNILEPLKEVSDSTIAAQKQDLENFCRYNGISSFRELKEYIDTRVVKIQKFLNLKKKFQPGED